MRNSKSEYRNSKQIQNSNIKNSKPFWNFKFTISYLFRASNFEFRISPAGFTRYINFGCRLRRHAHTDGRSCITGFTLLETIVAFAVIFAALVGPVSLVTRGIIDVTFAKNKLVALNLAQEGIELVRLARDNNVLCDYLNGATVREFGQNPDSSPLYLYDNPQPRKADALNIRSFSCGAATLDSPDFTGGAGSAVIRFYTGGSYADFYGHAGAGGSSVETPFSRKITIEEIDGGFGVYAMKVTSKVEWTERGRAREVTLIDGLYDWR